MYRLALAVVRAAEGGTESTSLTRYLEAWLLKLHGLYPALDRCAACQRPLRTSGLEYHAPSRGFVCEKCGPASGPRLPGSARFFLETIFKVAPDKTPALPEEAKGLEPFHEMLITDHLERPLRSCRVLRDVARGQRR